MSKAEIRKAAILLRSLTEEQAGALLAQLAPRQIDAVTTEMAQLDALAPAEQEAVFREFRAHGVLPVSTTPQPPARQRVARPLDALARLGDDAGVLLANALADERPQTIAFVASHVPAAAGAALLSQLSEAAQLAAMRAVASMEPTDPVVAEDVAAVLAECLPLARG